MRFKKLIAFILSLALIVGMIPGTAFATDGESATSVTNVEFDLEGFKVGKSVDDMVLTSDDDGEKYCFVKDVETDRMYKVFEDQNGKMIEVSEVNFDADKEYILAVEITPCDGYILNIADSGNYLSTEDGYFESTMLDEFEQSIQLYFPMGQPGDFFIKEIFVDNIDQPYAGEKPDYNGEVAENARYVIKEIENYGFKNGICWSKCIDQFSSEKVDPETGVFEEGATYTASIIVAPKEGYKFLLDENDSYIGTAYVNGMTAEVSYESDGTLSIAYAFVAEKAYNIDVANGYALEGRSNYQTPDGAIDKAVAGEIVKVKPYEIDGYVFDHWEIIEGNINVDDSLLKESTMYFDMPEGDVKLCAYFVKDGEGGEAVTFHQITYMFGNTPLFTVDKVRGEVPQPPFEPAQDGYEFVGWYTEDGEKYEFDEPLMENLILTAKFIPITEYCTVYFCLGSNPTVSQDVVKGEKVSPIADPYIQGKTFLGWYTEDGEKYDFNTPVTGELYLYAKFKVDPCKNHKWNSGKVTKKATVSADGKKLYTCTVCKQTKTNIIYKASGVKLSASAFIYNGKVRNPIVYVKDSKGKTIKATNYTITKPVGRKNVGKYTYKVTFKNDYKGTKSMTLNVNPKGTTLKKVTPSNKGFTAVWYKQSTKMSTSRITGYQIAYSTNKKFTTSKKVFVKGYSTTSKKIIKLSSKRNYYVKVRTYSKVKVNGKYVNLYSGWSGAKVVKTK